MVASQLVRLLLGHGRRTRTTPFCHGDPNQVARSVRDLAIQARSKARENRPRVCTANDQPVSTDVARR